MFVNTFCSTEQELGHHCGPLGNRLRSNAYDATIKRYRKSLTKIKVSKSHILVCMGLKFRVKFKGTR